MVLICVLAVKFLVRLFCSGIESLIIYFMSKTKVQKLNVVDGTVPHQMVMCIDT